MVCYMSTTTNCTQENAKQQRSFFVVNKVHSNEQGLSQETKFIAMNSVYCNELCLLQ